MQHECSGHLTVDRLNNSSGTVKVIELALMLSGDDWAMLAVVAPGTDGARYYFSFTDIAMREAFMMLSPGAMDERDIPELVDESVKDAGLAFQRGLRSFRAARHSVDLPSGSMSCMVATGSRNVRAAAPAVMRGLELLAGLQLERVLSATADVNGALADGDGEIAYMRHIEASEAAGCAGSWLFDPASGQSRWSPGLLRLLGEGQTWQSDSHATLLAHVPEDEQGRVGRAYQALLDGQAGDFTHRIVSADGSMRWVRHFGAPLADRPGSRLVGGTLRDLTELHRAEEQWASRSAAEAQRFRLLFESAPGLYLVLTPDRFEIILVSDAYLVATKVRREAIFGRIIFDVFPDDPADPAATGVAALSTSLHRARETGLPDVMAVQRYPIPRPQSEGGGFELRYWSPINSPVLDADGKVAFIIHRVEDVTDYVLAHRSLGGDLPLSDTAKLEAEIVLRSLELKRLADSLAQSEQRFRYVTRATNDVVWDWTLVDDTLWCSQSALEPIGSMLTDCRHLREWEVRLHPGDRTRVVESLRAAVAARQANWASEYRLVIGDGEERCVLHRCFLVMDRQGVPLRMVGSMADLTDQKRQETQVRMQAEMLDYATDAILVRDLENRVIYWNQAATERYGWTSADVIGRPVAQTLYAGCSPSDFEHAMQVLMQHGDFAGRMQHATASGSLLTVHAHWILVRRDDGSPRAILSVVTDLSDKIVLEQRLLQLQKLEALGRLTGGIAHDFNNWLTVIIGNAEELVDALAGQDELGDIARMIQLAGERGAQLTRRLLAFARRQPLAPEVVAVDDILRALRPLIARSLPENIALHLVQMDEKCHAFVDRGQLESAVVNLCFNARDAMPAGGELTIGVVRAQVGADAAGVHAPAAGEYVMIAIADTGLGIPSDLIDKVFEPFFTTKDEAAGSGLGLSMVYGFAKQSGGDVTIHSEVGHGTTVRLYLPQSRMCDVPAAETSGPVCRLNGCAVLLVEDDAMVRQHVAGQLREIGCEVTEVAGAEQALAHLEGPAAFDVLFSDVVMPGMSGIELVDRARVIRPGLRILLSSAYSFEAVRQQGRIDASVRLLNKPYGKALLARTLAEVIGDCGED
jgi:PAS domain S-box-containing protein